MRQSDRAEFAAVLAALCATCGAEASEPLAMGWWMALEDLSIEQVKAGIKAAMRTSRYMPKPAEVRELASGMNRGARALLAWTAVIRAIRVQGPYRTVEFDDPVIHAAIRSMGGWTAICARDSEDLNSFGRRDFERAYEAFAGKSLPPQLTPPLLGIFAESIHPTDPAGLVPVKVTTGPPAVTERRALPAVVNGHTGDVVRRIIERNEAPEPWPAKETP